MLASRNPTATLCKEVAAESVKSDCGRDEVRFFRAQPTKKALLALAAPSSVAESINRHCSLDL
jgi:hypothetical protein